MRKPMKALFWKTVSRHEQYGIGNRKAMPRNGAGAFSGSALTEWHESHAGIAYNYQGSRSCNPWYHESEFKLRFSMPQKPSKRT